MAEEKSSKTQFYRLVAPIEQLLTRFEKKITLSKKRNEKKKRREKQLLLKQKRAHPKNAEKISINIDFAFINR